MGPLVIFDDAVLNTIDGAKLVSVSTLMVVRLISVLRPVCVATGMEPVVICASVLVVQIVRKKVIASNVTEPPAKLRVVVIVSVGSVVIAF